MFINAGGFRAYGAGFVTFGRAGAPLPERVSMTFEKSVRLADQEPAHMRKDLICSFDENRVLQLWQDFQF